MRACGGAVVLWVGPHPSFVGLGVGCPRGPSPGANPFLCVKTEASQHLFQKRRKPELTEGRVSLELHDATNTVSQKQYIFLRGKKNPLCALVALYFPSAASHGRSFAQ